jgi:Lrp/AsnC family leucine-responsive transcriptional regulator
MAGDSDFLLRVMARTWTTTDISRSSTWGRIKGVRNIKTDIPLQKFRHSTELPVRWSGLPDSMSCVRANG